MIQKITKNNSRKTKIRIVADVERDVIAKLDRECESKGHCSRAAIIRMALMDRYRPAQSETLQHV